MVFTVNENHEIMSEETVSSPANCGCKSNIAQTPAQMGVKMMLDLKNCLTMFRLGTI